MFLPGDGGSVQSRGEDVWLPFKMSPRSRPVVSSKATLMQQKLPFSETHIRFPCKLSQIFFFRGGGDFSAPSRRIFTHVAPESLYLMLMIRGRELCVCVCVYVSAKGLHEELLFSLFVFGLTLYDRVTSEAAR